MLKGPFVFREIVCLYSISFFEKQESPSAGTAVLSPFKLKKKRNGLQ